MLLKGIPVILYTEKAVGKDSLNNTIYEPTPETIENVLVAPSSSQEILDATNLYGKKAIYTLAIPKEDKHDWRDKTVEFFGSKWKTFGEPLEGIESLIPLAWNKKVTVERYG